MGFRKDCTLATDVASTGAEGGKGRTGTDAGTLATDGASTGAEGGGAADDTAGMRGWWSRKKEIFMYIYIIRYNNLNFKHYDYTES